MTSFHLARPGVLARIAIALLAPLVFASCSSNVSGPPPTNDPGRITILPATAVLYSGLPTTFTINGGTGAYVVSSSNQSVIGASGPIERNTLTVIPANVLIDTDVTLTVRDTGTTPLATATLTVKPGTVNNDIQITPTATQGGNCAPAVCSGSDAIVSATISQGGVPLPARGVRLSVVSGDFRFITSSPGFPEVLETATTVVSDQAGQVLTRIRALAGAANQTAVLQVTDLGTNAFQRATFTIAQATGPSPGFFTVPDTIVFTGPNNITCATGVRADVTVFGGAPPYTIGNGGTAFSVSQNFVRDSGGSFYVVANGTCSGTVLIPIVDSSGRTTNVTVSNVRGENAIPDLIVAPSAVTLSDCSASASVAVAGGIPNSFTVSNTTGALTVGSNPSSRIISITRTPNTTATTPLSVGVVSGDKVATITVTLTDEALTTRCDGSSLRLIPSAITLASCAAVRVAITGGVPVGPGVDYAARSNNSSVEVNPVLVPTGVHFIDVRRTPLSATFDNGTVTVVDGAGITRTLTVTGAGSGPGSGTGACP